MKLNEARAEYDEKVVGVEHLWRELILLFTYVALEKQMFYVKKLPHFAAQHLLDGSNYSTRFQNTYIIL